MRPIPVAFHIWFIEVHTYGIGLALTFWFGLWYTERRIRNAGYPWRWITGMFLWVIVAALVGARTLHVLSDLSYYTTYPGQIPAIWQGGLSSFGGILFAVPVAIVSARRRCPELPTLRFGDLMAPVLMACWAMGRLLGPQLMRAGGGHPTAQWFGMYYADQVGKRLPVPIFQALEDATIYAVLLLVERWLRSLAPVPFAPAEGAPVSPSLLPPAGIVLGVGMVLWGIERFLDEHLWLGEDGRVGSDLTQLAGVLLAVAGVVLLATRMRRFREWRAGAGADGGGDGGGDGSGGDAGGDVDGDDGESEPEGDADGNRIDGGEHGDDGDEDGKELGPGAEDANLRSVSGAGAGAGAASDADGAGAASDADASAKGTGSATGEQEPDSVGAGEGR